VEEPNPNGSSFPFLVVRCTPELSV